MQADSSFDQIEQIPISPIPAANVSSVPQRSPLRYPGGKTWLIPHIREWIIRTNPKLNLMVEPFAGGGIVSLTSVMEGLAQRCIMSELDRDVAAFWHATLRENDALCDRILRFTPTLEALNALSKKHPISIVDQAFQTLALNRTKRGGILASGASFSRKGENGKGVSSRWYPQTIVTRLREIANHADRICFCETDGLKLLETLSNSLQQHTAVFIDPPYTFGTRKRAGRRLYSHYELDHARMFSVLADSGANFLMTYDATSELLELIQHHNFHAVRVMMKNVHHAMISELVITPRPIF